MKSLRPLSDFVEDGLGFPEHKDIYIYVEDVLSKMILEKLLEQFASFPIKVFSSPGGYTQIVKYILINNAISDINSIFYIFDGDQRNKEAIIYHPDKIAVIDYEKVLKCF
jgi:hypothetical protein